MSFLIYPTIKESPYLSMLGMGGGGTGTALGGGAPNLKEDFNQNTYYVIIPYYSSSAGGSGNRIALFNPTTGKYAADFETSIGSGKIYRFDDSIVITSTTSSWYKHYNYSNNWAETGGTFSPSKRNTAGSGATGLIQFTKETARNLGTTTQALSKMSAREQMSFVERYFSSIGAGNLARLRNGSQHDVNMAIFYPRAIGKGFNFNIAEDIRRTQSRGAANRFMRQNKGIKKAGDYTMKLTPPLPKLKPSNKPSPPVEVS